MCHLQKLIVVTGPNDETTEEKVRNRLPSFFIIWNNLPIRWTDELVITGVDTKSIIGNTFLSHFSFVLTKKVRMDYDVLSRISIFNTNDILVRIEISTVK